MPVDCCAAPRMPGCGCRASPVYRRLPEFCPSLEIIGLPLMERTRERAHFLDVIIEGEAGEIAAEVAGHVVGYLQRILDAIGQAEAGSPTSAGPIAQEIRGQTRLNVVGAFTGSLGFRFETDQQDSESEESLARRSLERLFDLLERVESGPRIPAIPASRSDSTTLFSSLDIGRLRGAYTRLSS